MMLPQDYHTATWKRLQATLQLRLAEHRASLEMDQPHEKSQILRGQIRALKQVLALPHVGSAKHEVSPTIAQEEQAGDWNA